MLIFLLFAFDTVSEIENLSTDLLNLLKFLVLLQFPYGQWTCPYSKEMCGLDRCASLRLLKYVVNYSTQAGVSFTDWHPPVCSILRAVWVHQHCVFEQNKEANSPFTPPSASKRWTFSVYLQPRRWNNTFIKLHL